MGRAPDFGQIGAAICYFGCDPLGLAPFVAAKRRPPGASVIPSLIGWRLSLPNAFASPRQLRNLQGSPGKSNFPACGALVRVQLAGAHAEIREHAALEEK